MNASIHSAMFLLLFFFTLLADIPTCSAEKLDESREYIVVGVSGGLQDGFPEHYRLDYHSGQEDEVQAVFLGKALVRGYKAFLDVMQEGWRQYTPEPGQPLINSNVFASGCHEHANEYWLYLVDSRQAMTVLNNEPRFLSITADTGQLELNAEETWPFVRDFMQHEIRKQGKSDLHHVAIPLVTAVWFQELSHVPSPPIHTHKDGTLVTNFPESLALWAGVNDTDRTAVIDSICDDNDDECIATAQDAEERYWNGIRKAVRNAEENRPSKRQAKRHGPPWKCTGSKRQVRFGVGANDTARVNYPFGVEDVVESLATIGYSVDFGSGTVTKLTDETKGDEL